MFIIIFILYIIFVMENKNVRIMLSRSTTVFENFDKAKEALTTQINKEDISDGEIVTCSYNKNNIIHTLFGIKRITNKGNGISYFRDIEASEETIQSIIDDITQAMQLSVVGEKGKFIQSIEQENGKISAVAEDLTAKNVSLTEISENDIIKLSATNVQEGISELFSKMIENEDVTAKTVKCLINVLGDASHKSDTGDIVYVKNEGDKLLATATSFTDANLKLSQAIQNIQNTRLYYDVVKLTDTEINNLSDGAKVREAYKVVSYNNEGETTTQVGDTIKIYKDANLKSAVMGTDEDVQKLVLTYIRADGEEDVVKVDFRQIAFNAEFKNGLQVSDNGEISVKRDSSSDDFLSVSEEGIKVSGVQTAIGNAINTLDVESIGEDGKFIKSVSQTDGKISAECDSVNANVVSLEPITESDDIKLSATNVQEGFQVLFEKVIEDEKITAQSIKSVIDVLGQASINVENGEIAYNGVNNDIIKSAISFTDADIKLANAIKTVQTNLTQYKVVKLTDNEVANLADVNVKEAYKVVSVNGETSTQVGDTIKVYKDGNLKDVKLDNEQKLILTYLKADGTEATVEVDFRQIAFNAEFKNGLQVSDNGEISVKRDSSSDDFLSVSEEGIKVSGVQTAIGNAINALDVERISEDGKFIKSVSQTDGKISAECASVNANVVSLEQITESDDIKLSATNVQEGISELFSKMIENEDVTSKTVKNIVNTLGSSSYEAETGYIKYIPNTDDTILGDATSFTDADSKLAQAIIALKTLIEQNKNEISSLKERIEGCEKRTTDTDVAKVLSSLTQVDETVFTSEEELLPNQNLIIDSGDY